MKCIWQENDYWKRHEKDKNGINQYLQNDCDDRDLDDVKEDRSRNGEESSAGCRDTYAKCK